MNQNDFYDWKKNPITDAVFNQLTARMEHLMEEVIEQTAYSTLAEMAEKTGAIKAIRDMLNISFEDNLQETEE